MAEIETRFSVALLLGERFWRKTEKILLYLLVVHVVRYIIAPCPWP